MSSVDYSLLLFKSKICILKSKIKEKSPYGDFTFCLPDSPTGFLDGGLILGGGP